MSIENISGGVKITMMRPRSVTSQGTVVEELYISSGLMDEPTLPWCRIRRVGVRRPKSPNNQALF